MFLKDFFPKRMKVSKIRSLLTLFSIFSGGGSDLSQSSGTTNLTGSSESLNKGTTNSHLLTLSELGNLVLRDESLGQCLTLTLLRALNWPDSHSSARASALLELIMPVLASSEQMSGADAEQVMFAILQALHTMGEYLTDFFEFHLYLSQNFRKRK